MDVQVDFRGDNVHLVVVANLGLVKVDGLNRVAGIADEKAHSKHVAGEAIVAPGCAEFVFKGREVPGACAHRVGVQNPGVL